MIDSAVAGARPAGLVVRAALDDLQIDHLVLNADGSDRAGVHSAGTRLRLNNPGWTNPMLGPHKPDTCPAAAEVADRLDLLAASRPIHELVTVGGVRPQLDGWPLDTGDECCAGRRTAAVVRPALEEASHSGRCAPPRPGALRAMSVSAAEGRAQSGQIPM